MGYDVGPAADANGIEVGVKQVGSITRFGAEVGPTSAFNRICEVQEVVDTSRSYQVQKNGTDVQ